MAKSKQDLRTALSSKSRKAMRDGEGPVVSLEPVHQAIKAARQKLIDNIPEDGDELLKERFIAAIRNLDLARVTLECNQSLSATDYNVEPWDHLKDMDKVLAGKKMSPGKKG